MRRALTVAGCLALTAAAAAQPASKLEQIRARGRLVVSVKNQGPASPSLHKDPAHFQKRGLELDLARAIARRVLGDANKLELRLMPKPTRVAALLADQVDLVISMLAVSDQWPGIVFSTPYFTGGLALLVPARSAVQKVEDLDGKVVAIVAQNANDKKAEMQAISSAKQIHLALTRYPSFAAAAAALREGRAQALVSLDANIDRFVAGNPDLRRTGELITHERYAVAVKRGNDDLLGAVNDTLDELRRSGELARLTAKWQLKGN
jgi:putative glutamine transport system substrate-binding protein